jgi:hypothetical protein
MTASPLYLSTPAAPAGADTLAILRDYRLLAPWSLRDLSALAGGILEASNVVPLNAAARARPSERTIRFYVARGLVHPPEGRGTAATYSYRHLLQVLAIKLRQMEGATLDQLVQEFNGLTGDVIERRVAAALGTSLPTPSQLPLRPNLAGSRGKVGRAVQARAGANGAARARFTSVRRLMVAPGLELTIDEQHPLFRAHPDPDSLALLLQRAVQSLLPESRPNPYVP